MKTSTILSICAVILVPTCLLVAIWDPFLAVVGLLHVPVYLIAAQDAEKRGH